MVIFRSITLFAACLKHILDAPTDDSSISTLVKNDVMEVFTFAPGFGWILKFVVPKSRKAVRSARSETIDLLFIILFVLGTVGLLLRHRSAVAPETKI